jgi:DNA-binding SARP family transcriptional activator
MHTERYSEAARTFRAALALWAGSPIANITCGPVLSAYAVDLQEQRRNAHYMRIQADIESGLHRELIGELRSLVAANPLDEGLHVQLMLTLSRSARRLEALEVYRELRATLNAELGLEPFEELQALHHELLCAGDNAA